jgi:pimeloyl-ACP methyl ester carboxylesterase
MPIAGGLYYSLYEGTNQQKTPVVFIHGAGGSHLYWPAVIRHLAGQRVICIDLPGHGRSDGASQQSVWGYAQRIANFVYELGAYRAIFVGHSLGGCLALALALEHPDQVAGLGLVATSTHIELPAAIMAQAAHAGSFPLFITEMKKLAFSPHTDARLVNDAMLRLSETRPSLLYNDLIAGMNCDIHDRLEGIQVPALIVTGADDQITPPACARAMAVNLPQANLHIIPQAGHMVQLEKPDALIAALDQFLDQFSD